MRSPFCGSCWLYKVGNDSFEYAFRDSACFGWETLAENHLAHSAGQDYTPDDRSAREGAGFSNKRKTRVYIGIYHYTSGCHELRKQGWYHLTTCVPAQGKIIGDARRVKRPQCQNTYIGRYGGKRTGAACQRAGQASRALSAAPRESTDGLLRKNEVSMRPLNVMCPPPPPPRYLCTPGGIHDQIAHVGMYLGT